MATSKESIIAALHKAYNMELETVTNYLANSIHLDGVFGHGFHPVARDFATNSECSLILSRIARATPKV